MIIDPDYCGVCEQCVPACTRGFIVRIAYTMKVLDGCDDCGECLDSCPLGAMYIEDD